MNSLFLFLTTVAETESTPAPVVASIITTIILGILAIIGIVTRVKNTTTPENTTLVEQIIYILGYNADFCRIDEEEIAKLNPAEFDNSEDFIESIKTNVFNRIEKTIIEALPEEWRHYVELLDSEVVKNIILFAIGDLLKSKYDDAKALVDLFYEAKNASKEDKKPAPVVEEKVEEVGTKTSYSIDENDVEETSDLED